MLSYQIELLGLTVVLFSQAVILMANYDQIYKFLDKFIQ